jgi:predicted AlkP superfamily pyrophosphatase or phosphodiesterase
MKRSALAATLAALVSACATLPPAPPPPRPLSNVVSDNAPPRLIVAIAVDQFSADLFDDYRGSFTGGLARLANQGAAFRNGYQSHSITETCLGHSTMLTGMHPAHTGIIGNIWYQPNSPRGAQPIYCAEDESKLPDKYDPANYVVSPVHLKVPVLGELLKVVSPRSQSVAVAGKDRAAVMMSGHAPDVRWYYRTRGSSGKFESDLPGAAPSPAVEAANRHIDAEIQTEQAAPMPIPAGCEGRNKAITIEGGRVVGTGRFGHGPDEKEYHSSPALDRDTVDLATALVDERQLGRDSAPDVLAISLSATDYIGHRYGTAGLEMCIQMHALDDQVGRLFAALDQRGIDYAVVLTADHGGTDIPERLRLAGNMQAEREPDSLNSKTIGDKIAQDLHLSANPLIGEGDIYVMPGLDAATRAKVIDATVAAYRAIPEVAAVYTNAQLAAVPVPTGDPTQFTLEQRARASFDPQRSGDVIVQLRQWVVPIPHPDEYYVATHGSAWDNDRRVPILFWRKGMAPESRDDPADTVDIMPTLAAMLGLPVQQPIDGRCLTGVSGVVCPSR